MSIKSQIQKLDPGAVVELFELDLTKLGGPVLRFHAGTNKLSQPVVWKAEVYEPFPIKAEGFDLSTNGTLPAPIVTVSNVGGHHTFHHQPLMNPGPL